MADRRPRPRYVRAGLLGLAIGVLGEALSVALGLSDGGIDWLLVPAAAAVGLMIGERFLRGRAGR